MPNNKKKSGHWSQGRTIRVTPSPVVPVESSELSHYGRNGIFHEQPRWAKEQSLSMSQGRVSADDLWFRMVRGERTAPKGSQVRIFETEDLISEEYVVLHSPTAKNDLHVSVGAPLESGALPAAHQEWWERPERVALSVLTKEVISVEK